MTEPVRVGNLEPSICTVCGFIARKKLREGKAARDSFSCVKCNAMLRHRDLAQLVIDEFGRGTVENLRQLANVPWFKNLKIYEPGIRGPFVSAFGGKKNYVQSYYWDDEKLGAKRDGIYCQDLRRLSFKKASFDLMISVDVMEHVIEPEKAFAEISRVLKPGGVHIFSVPLSYPLRKKSIVRAKIEDGEVRYIRRPHYHVAGDEGKSLVITDWGTDIIDMHAAAGLDLKFIRRSSPMISQNECASLVARKM